MRKLLLLLIILVGCSTPETIIKPRVVQVTVPEIKDSISASYINISPVQLDTLEDVFELLPDSAKFEGVKEIITAKGDKVKVKVSFLPKQKTFTIDIPSYKIDSLLMDTTVSVTHKKGWFETIEYYLSGVIVVLLLIFAFKFYKVIYG